LTGRAFTFTQDQMMRHLDNYRCSAEVRAVFRNSTQKNTVKHRDGSAGSVVANHRDGGESSVVVTTLTLCITEKCIPKRC